LCTIIELSNYHIGVIILFSTFLILPFAINAEGFLQTATKIEAHLQPGGESGTFEWGLNSEKDVPVQIKISAEGEGAELLSFPATVVVQPGEWIIVEIKIIVPADYPNNVRLEPRIYALIESSVEGAQVGINVRLQNTAFITIGNPPMEEPEVVETPTVKETPEESMEEKPMETQEEGPSGFMLEAAEEEGGGCLISTATYGSELAPQVQMLREIRDNKLLSTESGSTFMTGFNTLYYSFSPIIADWERESPIFREAVKISLTPLITSLSILNYVDMDSEAKVLGYGISLILLNIGMYFVAPAILISRLRR